MGDTLLNIGIVLLLILIEGLFVAAEIALVSLRDGQVRSMAETSRRGAAVAKLTADPNRFLAAVQIGVTSTALLSSAFGAVTLSDEAKEYLVDHGWSDGLASATGVIGVTLLITLFTTSAGHARFVEREQFRRVLQVLIPSVIFVIAIDYIGIYVAGALFIACFMWWLGKYPLPKVVVVSVLVPLILFFVFEVWFLVPLPKGPLEAALGY